MLASTRLWCTLIKLQPNMPMGSPSGSINEHGFALITGVTGEDGNYLGEILLDKGYEVYGVKRSSSSLNTARVPAVRACRGNGPTRRARGAGSSATLHRQHPISSQFVRPELIRQRLEGETATYSGAILLHFSVPGFVLPWITGQSRRDKSVSQLTVRISGHFDDEQSMRFKTIHFSPEPAASSVPVCERDCVRAVGRIVRSHENRNSYGTIPDFRAGIVSSRRR